MAQIKSAKTRISRNKKREDVNKTRLASVRTQVKKVRKDLASGTDAAASFKAAESALARAANRGTMPKKTAARKVSRLAKALKAAGTK